jgi:hypothetical protein
MGRAKPFTFNASRQTDRQAKREFIVYNLMILYYDQN